VSTVLGVTKQPTGGSAGAIHLPDTGQGGESSSTGYLLALLVLAMAGGGLVGAVLYRQRRG
jgi:hypothetical protein